jgi:2-polyprenyl-6-methoxyphenol hydroxylase-like FAD-dependent oxidoreductase
MTYRPAMDCDVLVVGAGPVGLTLAMNLAQRGRRVTLVETRARGQAPEPKCNHVAARSMEVFRRLGVAPALRAAGLPDDFPHDVSYRTTTTGREITRIHIPGRRTRYTDHSGPDGHWPTPEPPHRVNQLYLEPVLFAHAVAMPGVTVLNRCRVEAVAQDATGVSARIVDLDHSGRSFELRAAYLAGCDGGRSMVRKSIGARLGGDEVVQRVQSSLIRAPGLLGRLQAPPAWGMFSYNPRRTGVLYAIDGRELWLLHNYLRDDEADFDAVDRDWAIRTILGVGPDAADFDYELVSKEDWYGRRLVADKFRQGRIFLAGDAAHLWVPYAGYGMNAGIADATNLAWHLANVLDGWAGPAALDAYVRERQPITEQVSRFAMDHAHAMARRRKAVPAGIEADGAEGDALRTQVGRDLYDLNVQQYCCAGLNFGYYYDASPLIAPDGEAPPAYSMGSYTPSTVPGCRLPHFWLADGRSLYDALGPGYTLLCLRHVEPTALQPLVDAAHARAVPLAVLHVEGETLPPEYRHALLIARQDGHVAWRGDALAAGEAGALVELLRGATA